ncbi:DEAD-box ATP-dependent RNA helicase [Basidiobolus ranarum]|uniref:RNA helicase n=1 Tax=Basidiobolus ranarum TaxID=34480 RepID=A0ABR2W7K2_9FUNG
MVNISNPMEQRFASLNLNENGKTTPPKTRYVPPHLRNQEGNAASTENRMAHNSPIRNTRWDDHSGNRRQNSSSFFNNNSGGGRSWGRDRDSGRSFNDNRRGYESHGSWSMGKHVPCDRNPALERELYGLVEDKDRLSSGINFEKYEEIPVDATGDDVPGPIESFEDSDLDALLLSNIELARYTTPTPVQKHSVTIVGGGRDLMACAQTGSGKTGGFLFPILSECFKTGPVTKEPEQTQMERNFYRSRKAYPTALILAPTRELASQIFEEARKFSYRSWVKPCVAYGGADIGQQKRQIERGCDLLAATPGRLVDLIERGCVSLAKIKYLVLDEADRMLDMGFEPQIRRIVEEEDMPGVQDRQTLMFSATFPKDIQMLARDFLKEYIFLSVGRVGSTSENITQRIEYVDDEDKHSVLLDILTTEKASEGNLTLIFVETKRMADSLCDFLLCRNIPATCIHGDRTQRERERALGTFRTGRTPVMVATAVAARGLDIPNVMLVINYDLPTDVDEYVHRIGRTGRAGNMGIATSFFNRGNKGIARQLIEILKEANQDVPEWLLIVSREGNFNRSSSSRGRNQRNNNSRDFRKANTGSGFGWGSGSHSGGNKSSWF